MKFNFPTTNCNPTIAVVALIAMIASTASLWISIMSLIQVNYHVQTATQPMQKSAINYPFVNRRLLAANGPDPAKVEQALRELGIYKGAVIQDSFGLKRSSRTFVFGARGPSPADIRTRLQAAGVERGDYTKVDYDSIDQTSANAAAYDILKFDFSAEPRKFNIQMLPSTKHISTKTEGIELNFASSTVDWKFWAHSGGFFPEKLKSLADNDWSSTLDLRHCVQLTEGRPPTTPAEALEILTKFGIFEKVVIDLSAMIGFIRIVNSDFAEIKGRLRELQNNPNFSLYLVHPPSVSATDVDRQKDQINAFVTAWFGKQQEINAYRLK